MFQFESLHRNLAFPHVPWEIWRYFATNQIWRFCYIKRCGNAHYFTMRNFNYAIEQVEHEALRGLPLELRHKIIDFARRDLLNKVMVLIKRYGEIQKQLPSISCAISLADADHRFPVYYGKDQPSPGYFYCMDKFWFTRNRYLTAQWEAGYRLWYEAEYLYNECEKHYRVTRKRALEELDDK